MLVDGGNDVGVDGGVTEAVNRINLLAGFCLNAVGVVLSVRKTPYLEGVAGDSARLGGTLGAEDHQLFFKVVIEDVGGALDNTVGAVGEFNYRTAEVLGFDDIVIEWTRTIAKILEALAEAAEKIGKSGQ